MRSRVFPLLLFTGLASLTAVPYAAHAVGIPFFGPLVPDSYNLCPVGWPGVVEIMNRIIAFAITLAITFVAPLSIAYAGFLFVVNPLNPGGKEHARAVLLNTIIGVVIALAAYLIVDAGLTALTSKGVSDWTSQVFGGGGDVCLFQIGSLNQIGNNAGGQTVTGSNSSGGLITGGATGSGSTAQCASSNTACSVSAISAAGFSSAQANALSCIAITESSGNPNTPNSPTGACGTFQITHGNWNNPALHQGSCSVSTSCNDPTCNLQTAYLLSQLEVSKGLSPFQPWTCSGCNAKAQACINAYDPSGS